MNFSYPEGATPIDADEAAGLIPPHIAFQRELNEWEQRNILEGLEWATARRHKDFLSEKFIRDLHKHMLNKTWKWAGQFRKSDKSIGVNWVTIPESIRNLCDDAKYWIANSTYPITEVAVRFHHRLVSIHPFPNGNGRHSRLMADLIRNKLGEGHFTWGGANLTIAGAERQIYIDALKAADAGNITPLIDFAGN